MAELDDTAAEIEIDARTDADGAVVVTLSGELDLSNVARLDATIASTLAEHPARLVFDLSGLRFMDSAGIAVLVRASTQVETVHIRDPSPGVKRLIEITGLTGVLPTEP
jgi:anti-sigma B factor antagonist